MQYDVQVDRLKLRELRILLVVTQAGSMARAAKELAISQPAVSRAIADMEDTLGVPLFDRSSRGIEPTQYGHALLKRGVAVFDELKQGVQDIAYLSNPETGELRIGSSSSLSEGIVLAVVNQLSRKYPRVVFHVVPGGALALYDHLRARRIELGFARLRGIVTEDDVDAEILFEEPLVVVAHGEPMGSATQNQACRVGERALDVVGAGNHVRYPRHRCLSCQWTRTSARDSLC
jgi:DNA-binding transcriptional LysR family regulator